MPSKAQTYRAVLVGLAILIIAFVIFFIYKAIVGTKQAVQSSPAVNSVVNVGGAGQTIRENAPISNQGAYTTSGHGIVPVTSSGTASGNGGFGSGSGTGTGSANASNVYGSGTSGGGTSSSGTSAGSSGNGTNGNAGTSGSGTNASPYGVPYCSTPTASSTSPYCNQNAAQ